MLSTHVCLAISPGQADSLQKAQGNLSMFTVVNGAKILSRLSRQVICGSSDYAVLGYGRGVRRARAYASRVCGLDEYIVLPVDMELI